MGTPRPWNRRFTVPHKQTARMEIDFQEQLNLTSVFLHLCFLRKLHPVSGCSLLRHDAVWATFSVMSMTCHFGAALWVNEQRGLCALKTKLVLWFGQQDLEEGHLSTETPPCCLLNAGCQILSSSLRGHCWSGAVKLKFLLFWRTWGKPFSRMCWHSCR